MGVDRPDEIRFADTAYISWDKLGSFRAFGWLDGEGEFIELIGLIELIELED
jgi:hypothetical protein